MFRAHGVQSKDLAFPRAHAAWPWSVVNNCCSKTQHRNPEMKHGADRHEGHLPNNPSTTAFSNECGSSANVVCPGKPLVAPSVLGWVQPCTQKASVSAQRKSTEQAWVCLQLLFLCSAKIGQNTPSGRGSMIPPPPPSAHWTGTKLEHHLMPQL